MLTRCLLLKSDQRESKGWNSPKLTALIRPRFKNSSVPQSTSIRLSQRLCRQRLTREEKAAKPATRTNGKDPAQGSVAVSADGKARCDYQAARSHATHVVGGSSANRGMCSAIHRALSKSVMSSNEEPFRCTDLHSCTPCLRSIVFKPNLSIVQGKYSPFRFSVWLNPYPSSPVKN
jgi:hypothetical protein